MLKKVLVFFTLLLISVLGISAVCSASVDYSDIIESESNWIASLQEPSGAIVMTRDHTYSYQGVESYKVEPYFANLAVIGMLENASKDNLRAAKKWMEWYLEHLNNPDYNTLSGTIYVYYLDVATKENYTSSSDYYDSTDSYAATFLTMLEKYVLAGGDQEFVAEHKGEIIQIANAMLATMQPDGLTIAKPDYAIKYLMDNSEVYEGLRSAAWLAKHIWEDESLTEQYQALQALNSAGIETLWSSTTNNYKAYEGVGTANWNIFYPDATAQVFPIWNGVMDADGQRAADLYGSLNTYHPGWPYLNTADEFAWSILAYSAAVMGDKGRVDAFLNSVKAAYIDQDHQWLWYNMEAGFTARAARTIRDQTNVALNKPVIGSDNLNKLVKINDGDLNNSWKGAKKTDWIQIDLGQSQTINRILMKWNTTYADQYEVQVSEDTNSFTTVYTEAAGNGQTDDIQFADTQARYVKINFTHAVGKINLREVEMYNEVVIVPPNPNLNLALDAMATASSDNENAFKSIDGDATTRWSSDANDNEWFQINLGSIKAINKVVIDWEAAYDRDYAVQTSIDGSHYTTVYTTSAGDGGTDSIRFATVNAVYVRIVCTTRATGYGSSFWEVSVYNDTSNPSTLPNLALNQPTDASTQAAYSNLSVDGSLSTRWGSDPLDDQWYSIDLGSVESINKVVIDWEGAYDSAYAIQLSSDGVTYTTVYATTTSTGGTNIIVFPLTDARYVKILCITRATPYGSSFWEVGVYQDLSNMFVSPNLALNKTASASTNTEIAYRSIDGDPFSRWGAEALDDQWYLIDLGSAQNMNRVVIDWEVAYASSYSIQLSSDGNHYTTAYSTTAGVGGSETITFDTSNARFVKVLLTTRGTPWGSSFWEIGVYND